MANKKLLPELEAYFSSDGKHTIHVKCGQETPLEVRKQAIADGMNIYRFVIKELGTKAEMWDKAMNGKKEEKTEQKDCKHELYKIFQVKKEGPNKGRHFKSCTTCRAFVGWVD